MSALIPFMAFAVAFTLTGCHTCPPASQVSDTKEPAVTSQEQPRASASQEGAIENPNWKNEEPLRIHSSAFLPLQGGAFKGNSNYLALPTTYPPVKEVFAELEKRLGFPLISRGEAHVTVLTPPEYKTVSQWVSIKKIEKIADTMGIESTQIEPVCLGRGRVAQQNGQELSTYFIVVKAPHLVKIREAIAQEALKASNGKAQPFDPARFFSHITVGFTKSDLHEAQGVIKGENSCLFPLQVY